MSLTLDHPQRSDFQLMGQWIKAALDRDEMTQVSGKQLGIADHEQMIACAEDRLTILTHAALKFFGLELIRGYPGSGLRAA